MATHSSILSEESHGQRSLVGYSPLGSKELGTSEQLCTRSGPSYHTCCALTLAQTQFGRLSNTELNQSTQQTCQMLFFLVCLVGFEAPAGDPQDRELLSVKPKELVMRFVDPDAHARYGTFIYSRCG